MRTAHRPCVPPVLVVEDDPHYGYFLMRCMRAHSFPAQLVTDGITALKVAVRERPRLVLLDLGLPGLHGFKVLRRLRGDPRTARGRVIVITASSDENGALWNAADALRADFFFRKTSSARTLLEAVNQQMSPRPPSSPGVPGLVLSRGLAAVDIPGQTIRVAGRDYPFASFKNLLLLAALLDHSEPVSAVSLLREVWPRGESLSVVGVTIARLRAELESLGVPLIVKATGYGYQLMKK